MSKERMKLLGLTAGCALFVILFSLPGPSGGQPRIWPSNLTKADWIKMTELEAQGVSDLQFWKGHYAAGFLDGLNSGFALAAQRKDVERLRECLDQRHFSTKEFTAIVDKQASVDSWPGESPLLGLLLRALRSSCGL